MKLFVSLLEVSEKGFQNLNYAILKFVKSHQAVFL